MFHDLMGRVKEEVIDILFKIQISTESQVEEMKRKEQEEITLSHSDGSAISQPKKRTSTKLKRNDPCHCGSGKKYKKCCMP